MYYMDMLSTFYTHIQFLKIHFANNNVSGWKRDLKVKGRPKGKVSLPKKFIAFKAI